jgi:hypothetical protein
MTAKKVWAKSTNGPDVTDVESLMRAIGGLHSAHVAVTLSPSGIGSTGGVKLLLTASFDVLPGSSVARMIQAESEWPCAEGHDIWAHIFEGLYQLDFQIGEAYQNEALWK